MLSYVSIGFLGLPMSVVIALAIAVSLTLLTGSTRFGRYLYAVGGNREASYLSGINIEKTVLTVFVIMGLIYGLAGIMAAARLDAVVPSTGSFLELEAIAAAVIGGVSLSGGTGSVHGALVGALLLTSIDNGMSLLNVSSFIQLVVKALLLLFAVWFDVTTRSKLAKV
jgi:D-xylose transport system permease protein